MKIKSRNLLTVILAMLCAVAVAIGVSFALPEKEAITADAAAIPVRQSTFAITDGPKVSAVGSNAVRYYSNFGALNSGYGSASASGGIGSMSGKTVKSSSASSVGYYVAFTATIDVPKYTEYKVKYKFTISVSGSVSGSSSPYAGGEILYFGDSESGGSDKSTSVTFGSHNGGSTYSIGGKWVISPGSGSATVQTSQITYTNSTNADKTCVAYFGCFTNAGASGGSAKNSATVNFSGGEEVITEQLSVTVDKTTDEYDPTGNVFAFTFDQNKVALDSLTYTDATSATSTPSSTIDSLGNCMLTDGVGTYDFVFDIINGGAWDNNPLNIDQGTYTITVTITPKKLAVPTIATKTAEFDPTNGADFAVTGFDSTTMTAETVPNPSTDISWIAGSAKFNATKVGTYTVKFKLQDTKNYEWDVSGGTTVDQTITNLKVDPKKLDVPSITAPQEYTGSALQFVLTDFNAGQYISMDGVTAANGSTVTCSSSTGETDSDKQDTFDAVKVGKYTVALSLRDTTNYAWKDGTSTAKDVEFEITQKELLSAPPASSSGGGPFGAEWKFGDSTVTITITDDRASGENINLLIYYDVAGGTSKANTLTGTFDGTNTTTITMPNNIAVGKYTLTVELNGNTGDNANYKITKNNTLNFEVTSEKLDPSKYDWTYTKDGAAGSTIADGGKLQFELKAGSTTDGVKYELSIKIPDDDADKVAVDTSKYANGYQLRSGDSVNTYKTIVALKIIDSDFQFEVGGVMQDTCEVELNWEIEKGTFDLTNVKWEYTTDNGKTWTEYNSSNPPQYNDGNYVTVRVKATTLPNGLTLDSMYDGDGERVVGNYTANISASDLVYNTTNFNAPDVSKLTLSWEVAKKNLFSAFTNSKEPYSNANGSGTFILKKLKFSDPKFDDYVEYKYYDLKTGLPVTLEDIKNAADPTDEKKYKVEAYIKPEYAANYEVTDSGATPQDQFKTGSKNVLATATIDGADGSTPITVEYDGNTHFDPSVIKVVGDDGITVTDYTVTYYKGKTPIAGNELAAGELPKDAGEYCIEIVLGPTAEAGYILGDDWFTVTVEAKGIALPTLGQMIFNGNEQNFVDFLSGESWTTYGPAGLNIIKVDGILSDRNGGAGNYVTTLELLDKNYKWIYPSSISPTKAIAKYSLAVDGYKVTGDDVTATYNWNITPLIVDTTNMWSKSKTGATLKLPQNVRDLIAGGTLEVGYRYYDSDGNFVEEPELKGGRSFKVEAVFAGDDAERNVQFKRSETDFGSVSKSIDYTVPQSGAAAFFGNVKDALSKTWLGLPIWAWLLITLALIILLIVIIVVAVKRRKTKEEKEEIKARKEEERLRKEEEREAERQRREDERRLQQEKLEAERELAKAKQEAELEKIRAQAQMAGAAGMATMAVQQQPQQQIPPQPVQHVQTVDNDLLREMRQQMAELRADNKETQAQLRAMQNQPQPMYQQYPQYPMMQQMPMMPQYPQMSNYGGDPTLARLEAQLNAMQAEQRARYDAEQRIELAAMRAEQHVDRDSRHSVDLAAMREHYSGRMGYNNIPDYSNQGYNQQANSVEALGAIVAAALKNINAPAQPVAELPQQTEASAPAEVKYPSDAVITTTTTVDTTKNKPIRRERDEEFDVDGFYDPLD
ncbi:MAG: hypothetical protein K2N22_04465 [Clostridia bacterium]|nr:hypothetical protein [Clostridia bacterium]